MAAIGEMDKRISFLQKTISKDNGFKKETWSEVFKAWSKISMLKRSRVFQNENETEEKTILFEIRYREIDMNLRIQYQGKTYMIENVEDRDFAKRFVVISAKEVR
jgi:SPP1 family predicted phage head-tail adaptor